MSVPTAIDLAFDSAAVHWQNQSMAFTLEPVSIPWARSKRQRITFEIARARMVANLRAELARFIEQGRNTRRIIRLSPSETVFIFTYANIEAIQAKVSCERGADLKREVDRMLYAVLQ